LVLAGKVQINGHTATAPGDPVDPDNDIIEVDGEPVLPVEGRVYILLNKAPGYISTTFDPRGHKTIMDLLPPTDKRIYPVGRLDKDTEGLLIITNDGELTHYLTHPRYNINKVYLAYVAGKPDDQALDKLRRGVMLDDGMTAPALVERESCSTSPCLRITIHEGRKRQIKRMCAAVGHKVRRLRRIQVGPLHLGDLAPGGYRYLSQEEVEALKHAALTGENQR
jgi:23S rRNA pseudouridine2605 synthase